MKVNRADGAAAADSRNRSFGGRPLGRADFPGSGGAPLFTFKEILSSSFFLFLFTFKQPLSWSWV